MRRNLAALACILSIGLLLSGCSTSFSPAASTARTGSFGAIHGVMHGGRQPISGARIFLFAAGTGQPAGPGLAAYEGNASVSLLNTGTCDNDSGSPTYLDCYVTTDSGGGFNLGGLYTCTPGTQVYMYGEGGDPGGGENPSAGLMAILGECPAGGSLAGTVPNVYLTELSTVVAAYSFAGYASDALHVSSTGTALARQGIANAFATSKQLYDLSTYLFSAYSTNPYNTLGTVPQQLINSLANSLAACVNSNSFNPPNGGACYTLFQNTKDSFGNPPGDTASAAINIAHNPTANVATIFGLPGPIASYPYGPHLLASSPPQDFTIAITYSGAYFGNPGSQFEQAFLAPDRIAVDANGTVWITENSTNQSDVIALLSNGAPASTYPLASGGSNQPQGIAIDQNGVAWMANKTTVVSENNNDSSNPDQWTSYHPASLNFPFNVAVDANNNVWFTNTGGSSLAELDSSNGNTLNTPVPDPNLRSQYIGVNSQNVIWLSEQTSDASASYYTTLTGPDFSAPTVTETQFSGGTLGALAIDSSDNVWFTSTNGPSVTGPALTKIGSSGTLLATCSGAGMGASNGIAVDGAGNVWAAVHDASANSGSGLYTIAACNNSAQLITPATGLTGGAHTYPQGIAIDGSGNIWYTNYYNTVNPLPGTPDGSTVVELIGAATPVITPISPRNPANNSNTGLGARP